MTRKDFTLIADAIRNASEAAGDYADPAMARNGTYEAASYIAHALRRDNPRFERARFMEACGFPACK